MNWKQKPIGYLLAGLLLVLVSAAGFAEVASLPPLEAGAKDLLMKSPRHGEWVTYDAGGGDKVEAWLVYPERKDGAPVVIVIHEIFGLTDWARGVADQLAEAGYIAIAPDLLWGSAPDGGGTEALIKSGSQVGQAIRRLPPEQITADLNAVVDYVAKLPSCNGKVTVSGFCWGGTQSFRFATNNKDLKAAFVFYGSGPDDAESIARINCPVYGFYGENDNRVNATLDKSKELMQAAGKTFEPVIYDGAGHGFMRAGEAPDTGEANKQAREDAWKRWQELLRKN